MDEQLNKLYVDIPWLDGKTYTREGSETNFNIAFSFNPKEYQVNIGGKILQQQDIYYSVEYTIIASEIPTISWSGEVIRHLNFEHQLKIKLRNTSPLVDEFKCIANTHEAQWLPIIIDDRNNNKLKGFSVVSRLDEQDNLTVVEFLFVPERAEEVKNEYQVKSELTEEVSVKEAKNVSWFSKLFK